MGKLCMLHKMYGGEKNTKHKRIWKRYVEIVQSQIKYQFLRYLRIFLQNKLHIFFIAPSKSMGDHLVNTIICKYCNCFLFPKLTLNLIYKGRIMLNYIKWPTIEGDSPPVSWQHAIEFKTIEGQYLSFDWQTLNCTVRWINWLL